MVQRQGGRRASRVARGLLGAALAMASTVPSRSAGTIESARRGARQGTVARASEPGSARGDVDRAGSRRDHAAARGHAPSARSRRAGGRGARGLRPALTGVPPFPDAGTVRTALRSDAGHHRTGDAALRHEGLDGRDAVVRPGCRCPSRAPWRRSSPPSRPRSSATTWLRGRPGTTTSRPRRYRSSVAPQIQGILGLNTLSPPKPSTTVPQASPVSPHGPSFAATPALAPGQPSPQPGSCTTSIIRSRCSTGGARCRPIGAGVLVRPALLREPLRGGDHRRPSGDVRCRLPVDRHQHFRQLLRHLARWQSQITQEGHRRRQSHGRRHRRGGARHRECALPGAQGEHRGLRGRSHRTASTTSSVGSSATTRRRS